MKTVYMMKGLPACGKSTRAKQMLREFGVGNAKIVNKDQLRAMLDDSEWSKSNEKFVLNIRDSIIQQALETGKHVIVDDTNLALKHEERLKQIANFYGARFEVVDMTGVCVEDCLERDKKRPNYVGRDVILSMYRQFICPPIPAPFLLRTEAIVIVDLDGTVFELNGRDPYDASTCENDKVRWLVVNVIDEMRIKPIFVSGRSDKYREQTLNALVRNAGFHDPEVYMRKEGDNRKDWIVKEEIFNEHIKGKYNVWAIFDDRPQIIRLWQRLGYADRIFNVGDGTEF